MARIRTVKPDFWDSADTASADLRTRLLYIAMWNWADDYGIGDGHPGRIINFAFPSDGIPAADYPRLLADVSRAFGVVFFEHLGRPYYTVPAWDKHQRTEKKAKPKDGLLEAAQDAIENSVFAGQTADAESPRNVADYPTPTTETSVPGSRKSEVGKGTGEVELEPQAATPKNSRASRLPDGWMPTDATIDAIKVECPGVNLEAEHRKFVDYYLGTGKPMKNWDATWRNWMRRADERTRAPLRVVNGGSAVDDKVGGWFDMAGTDFTTTGRELE